MRATSAQREFDTRPFSRRCLAASLCLLWLMPSVVACLVGLHVALMHHAHGHSSGHEHAADHSTRDDSARDHSTRDDSTGDGAAHEAEHAEAAGLVAGLVHRHHHEVADSAEHSHDVLLPFAKLSERLTIGHSSTLRPADRAASAVRATALRPTDSLRSSPPLFRTLCTLLI